MVHELYEEIHTMIGSLLEDGARTDYWRTFFDRSAEMREILAGIDEAALSPDEAAQFTKACRLTEAVLYARNIGQRELCRCPSFTSYMKDMCKVGFKTLADLLQYSTEKRVHNETTAARLSGAADMMSQTAQSSSETIITDTEELVDAFKDPESPINKEFAEFAATFSFQGDGDFVSDTFMKWCGMLSDLDSYRQYLNEKILEYFNLYYQTKAACLRDVSDSASLKIDELRAFVHLDTAFLSVGSTNTDLLFESVFLDRQDHQDRPFSLDLSEYQLCVARFKSSSEKQVMQQSWVFACIFQALKKLSDSDFKAIYADPGMFSATVPERYQETLEKYGLASTYLMVEKNIQGTSLAYDVPEERKLFMQKLVFYFGMWELLSENRTVSDSFHEVLSSGDVNRLQELTDSLNSTGADMGMNRADGKELFTMIDHAHPIQGRNPLSSVLAHAIYTLTKCTADSTGFIVNEMNFIEKQQEELFVTLTGKERFYIRNYRNYKYGNDAEQAARNAAEQAWQKTCDSRARLGVVDCGFSYDWRQQIPFYPEETMYLDRKMKCRYFSIPDKKFNHWVNKAGDLRKDEAYFWNKYDEDYRVSNRNNLNTVYLQLIRNIETHFALHHSVESLLNDQFSKRWFLEALIDCLEYAGKIVDEDPDLHHQAAAEFMSMTFADVLSHGLLQVYPEDRIVGKPFLRLIFTEDATAAREDALDKVELIKFQKLPDYERNTLRQVLNFFYGIEKNFLDRNKFSVVFYLLYLSLALYEEQNQPDAAR